MCSPIVKLVLATLVVQTYAKEIGETSTAPDMDKLTGKIADSLFNHILDRALQVVPARHTNFDSTVLAKPAQAALSSRSSGTLSGIHARPNALVHGYSRPAFNLQRRAAVEEGRGPHSAVAAARRALGAGAPVSAAAIAPAVGAAARMQQRSVESAAAPVGTQLAAYSSASQWTVMINGLPGPMCVEIAQACLRRGFNVAPIALTGPGMPDGLDIAEGDTKANVKLIPPSDPDAHKNALMKVQQEISNLIVIDFTVPQAMMPNAKLYTSLKVPFVMGTTGGDREALMDLVTSSGTYAVIAPNMCKQIVALQATMEHMAKTSPGAFGGYKLDITESHQSSKLDTSGTAKAIMKSFNGLGVDSFDVDQINMIRDPEKQKEFGVPEDALGGHAWHTYTVTSGDGSVEFQFKHNVCGRRTYAEGTADALSFLSEKIKAGSEKKVFTMIDVLAEGGLAYTSR